ELERQRSRTRRRRRVPAQTPAWSRLAKLRRGLCAPRRLAGGGARASARDARRARTRRGAAQRGSVVAASPVARRQEPARPVRRRRERGPGSAEPRAGDVAGGRRGPPDASRGAAARRQLEEDGERAVTRSYSRALPYAAVAAAAFAWGTWSLILRH